MTFALEFVVAGTLATCALCWAEGRNRRGRQREPAAPAKQPGPVK